MNTDPESSFSSTCRIQDIANALNLAKSTVSLALRNNSKIALKTKKRVQEKAKEMGYRPNPFVQANMLNVRKPNSLPSQPIIAFISDTFQPESGKLPKPIQSYYEGSIERANTLGFKVESFGLKQDHYTGESLSKVLSHRGILGAIIPPLVDKSLGKIDLRWESMATATIGYTLSSPAISRVFFDPFGTLFNTLTRVVARGYKRIGFLLTEEMDLREGNQWSSSFLGFRQFLPETYSCQMLRAPKLERPKILEWLKTNKPECVVVLGMSTVNTLKELGYRTPDDLAVVFAFWREGEPNYAGYEHPFKAIAAAAVDIVVSQLYRNELGIPQNQKTTLINSIWREGFSLPGKELSENLPKKLKEHIVWPTQF